MRKYEKRTAEQRHAENEAAMRERQGRREVRSINRLSGAEKVKALYRAKLRVARAKRVDRAAGRVRRENRNARRLEAYHLGKKTAT